MRKVVGIDRKIKRAWLDHLVIVFRGQAITQEQQLRCAAHFGRLGERKQAPAALASRTEGIYQTDKRVLLVSNIKEQGRPTRSAALILRSQRLGEGTVLQRQFDPATGAVTQQYGPTQIPFELTA